MSATITTSLQPFQKAQIQSMNPAFPVDDAELFAIYELDGSIRSATAFLNEGDDTYECYAFTDQKYRRQGLFAELLDLAIEVLHLWTDYDLRKENKYYEVWIPVELK